MGEITVSQEPGGSKDIDASVDSFADIDLIALIEVLWKRKYLVLAGSLIPAIIMALMIYFSPCNFRTDYIYSDIFTNGKFTNESKLEVFLAEFYSIDNLDRIVGELNNEGLDAYASLLNNARKRDRKRLEQLVSFRIWPPTTNIIAISKSKPAPSAEGAEYLSIKMTISTPGMQNEMVKIAKVYRGCFEQLLSFSDMERELSVGINDCRTLIATIEKRKFTNSAELKSKINYAAKLKELAVSYSSMENSNLSLQFNVGAGSKFLPLPFRIQAEETGIILLQADMSVSEENRHYYEALIAQCEILLSEIRKHKSSGYSVQEYQVFVSKLAESKKGTRLGDYLSSYLWRVENRIQSCVPVTELPHVEALAKGTVKKSGLVFVISFGFCAAIAIISDCLCRRRKAS